MYKKQGWGKRFYCISDWRTDKYPLVRYVFGVMVLIRRDGRIMI